MTVGEYPQIFSQNHQYNMSMVTIAASKFITMDYSVSQRRNKGW